MKLAISSFYDTMGEDDGNVRHEPPEEVEQVRFLNFFRLIQNIFLSLCENSTYLKVEFLQNIGLLLSTFAFECLILFFFILVISLVINVATYRLYFVFA